MAPGHAGSAATQAAFVTEVSHPFSTTDPGSFRDPTGQVHLRDGRVLRTVMPAGVADFEFVEDSGALTPLIEAGRVIGQQRVALDVLGSAGAGAAIVIEHPRLPFISYPYEWPFAALKAAALAHLDIQLHVLERDVSLSDASAYNVQFLGSSPVFIDRLSFRRYTEGELWIGHRQYCEQFLNPLLLTALLGVPYHAWYRGSLEGIPTDALDRLLPMRRKLSWNLLTHVALQAKLQRGASSSRQSSSPTLRPMPKAALAEMLRGMRKWVGKIGTAKRQVTTWSGYANDNSYNDESAAKKRAFVGEFASHVRPPVLWDLGCNTGEYSSIALANGAGYSIGFDADAGALDQAWERSRDEQLDFLPLYADIGNPTPNQGFAERERQGLAARGPADALLALALIHHLAIARNLPLGQLVDWLVSLAPRGVVEFVPKNDPMVQTLLRLREDIFDDYCEAAFASLLGAKATIVRSAVVSESGRKLFWYDASE